MEEIRGDQVKQISGGTYKEERNIQDILNRVFRDHVPFPSPVPTPSWR